MAIRSTFTTGEVLTAADLTDTIKGAFINTETTTARTLGTADAGNLVTLNNNSGGTVTIPTNTTWGSPLGTLVHLINIGTAGSFTVGTAAGVTLNAASATLAIQEGGTLIKTATNTWQFVKGGGLGKAQYSSTTGSPTVTTVSGKTCVEFTGSGSITISQAGLVEVLVVGGGGGATIGGGGAGGVFSSTTAYLPTGSFTVTVGAGGSGGATLVRGDAAQNGISSQVAGFIGVGGGGGTYAQPGMNGGSGGGATSGKSGGSYVNGQGNAGGNGTGAIGGGGGGAGAAGQTVSSTTGGNGGNGAASSITGTSVTYGGGGGGGGSVGGSGGTGGGGAGTNNTAATAGTANLGGGGGGRYDNNQGANGGSGIVILLFG